MRITLLFFVLAGAWVIAEEPAIIISPVKYAEGRDAFKLSDGKSEAIVIPSLGRVMHYSQKGGANWLWNAPAGQADMMGWKNFGGEKAWISPQAAWPAFLGRNFPPDEAWESGFQSKQLKNPPRLQIISAVSKCGIQITREFTFNADGEFVTTTTLEKMDNTPIMAGAWTITQIPPPDAVFMPTSETSAFKNNFYTWERKQYSNMVAITPTLLRVTPSETGAYKVGVDSPNAAIAAVHDGIAFLQRAEMEKAKYPDGPEESGFPVELFDLGGKDRHYLELELLSPITALAKGMNRTFVVRWSLHALPSHDIESAETKQVIDKLIHAK